MNRAHRLARCVGFLAIVGLCASPLWAGEMNEEVTNNTGAAAGELNLVLEGDQTASVSEYINPFSDGSVTSSYDAIAGQTTIKFISATGIADGGSTYVGLTDAQSARLINKYWGPVTDNPPPSDELPSPTFSGSLGGSGSNVDYIVVFGSPFIIGRPLANEWSEISVPKGSSFNLLFSNLGTKDGTLDLNSIKFLTSPTMIPLDSLNMTDLPPTSSLFKPVPGIPDGTTVGPGATVTSSLITLPEPGGLLPGVGALIGLGWRRRNSGAGATKTSTQ
jgi:hypothetical protein